MQLLRPRHAAAGVAAVTALVLAGCSSSAPGSGLMADGSVATSSGLAVGGTLNAAGSTFQLTFQEEAVSGFKAVQPNMTVNYNGVGSGAGRNDLAANQVSMAASDSPIPGTEAANFKGKTVLYFPVVIGPVTLAYHLTGVPGLNLTAPVIAAIFDGRIKTWDDPAIEQPARHPDHPRRPLRLLRHDRQLHQVPGGGRGQRVAARHRLSHHLAGRRRGWHG
jgi:phosphate transport system substrate-binding protein